MFLDGIKKFPKSAVLNINYAFFLREWKNQKDAKVLAKLKEAQSMQPYFDEQFVIFRYTKLLEEFSTEAVRENGRLDTISFYSYNNYFDKFCDEIELTTEYFIDF